MPALIITRGLPGSGKTTWARKQRGYHRVNRDDIRAMLLPTWPHGDKIEEAICTLVSHQIIEVLLGTCRDVICDDTNLNPDHLKRLMAIGYEQRAEIVIQDFTNVSVEDCIYLDSTRPNPVGRDVIIRMWERYLKEKTQ